MGGGNRRRPTSATPTSRPRRIAGRSGSSPSGEPGEPAEPTTPVEPDPDPAPAEREPVEREPVEREPVEREPVEREPGPEVGALESEPDTGEGRRPLEAEPEPEAQPRFVEAEPEPEAQPGPVEAEPESVADDRGPTGAGLVGSERTTRLLLRGVVALAVLALAGFVFLRVHDDDSSPGAPEGPATIAADAETPVRITGEDARVAVAAAAQAAYTIVATSHEDYQAQVEEAAALMTPAFAEEYRRTAEDVADAIISSKTEVQVSVVAQGVVRADQEQVQALVFLNQYVTKNGEEPVFTPYRALVTVVNTDQGWLVSALDTQ